MASSWKCTQCGAELFDDARFCVHCGTPRADAPATSAPMTRKKTTTRARAVTARTTATSMSEALAQADIARQDEDKTAVDHPAVVAPAEAPDNGASADGPPISAMLEDIDDSFDKIFNTPEPGVVAAMSAPTGGSEDDDAEVEALFRQIARAYVGPVRELAIELELGEPSSEWLALCLPAVRSLERAATDMGLDALGEALGAFAATLAAEEQTASRVIAGPAREQLITGYAKLATNMPEAFAVDGESTQREGVIVQSLLLQVPGVRKVALDRIFGAGLTSLSMLYAATPDELAHASGIPRELADRVVARFREHKRQSTEAPAGHAADREVLRALTQKLADQNREMDGAQRAWGKSAAADKRRVRQAREETLLELNVVLARLGALPLVKELERAPFGKKTELLQGYLEAEDKKIADAAMGDAAWQS